MEKMTVTIGNTSCILQKVSGSGCTFIKFSLAKHIVYNPKNAKSSEKTPLKIKSFSNGTVANIGTLKTTIPTQNGQRKKH